ncbi:MAG: DUF1592 domain-containing protein [Pirellulales bacterium]
MSAPSKDRRLGAVAVVLLTVSAVASAAEADGSRLLHEHCSTCHFDGAAEGGVALDRMLEQPGPGGPPGSPEHARWVAVWKNLRAGTMPPADDHQPSAADRRALVAFVSRDILGVDPRRPDPGHVVLRRLNRVEYATTVSDLTGVDEHLADDLPADDTGYGFDTIGDVLSLSPLLMEKYLELAARVGDRVATEAANRSGNDYPAPLRRLFPLGPAPAGEAARAEHLRATLRRLADRGFRRPVDEPALERLVAVAKAAADGPAGSFETGVAAAVTAVLASPRFLFRIEDDAPPDATRAAVPVDEFALASRLSYFLWSTMPDDELFRLAAEGRLRADLPRQVERMVKDPRGDALARNFVGQWLQTRDVEELPFDVRRILGTKTREEAEHIFSGEVRRAMQLETNMLFAHVLRENLPATDLLVGSRTFLNEPLARYYGIPDVKGQEMRLVDVPGDSHRGGVLTHGSFLVVTSNPTRSSPVKRGLFVLDNLLGTPPPPPPANVPPLEEAETALNHDATMRQVMERHRADAVCASCHARMDPLGLALERYDAVGRWRDDNAAGSIDTAGRLITGESFADVAGLAQVIAGPRRRDFHRCLAEKLLTYAVGRGVEYFDAPAVDTMVEELERDGRLVALVQGVVASVPFQMRRDNAPPATEGSP